MENQSEKLDHQVAGLPSLCLASSRIQFSVHTTTYFRVLDGSNVARLLLCSSNVKPRIPFEHRLFDDLSNSSTACHDPNPHC